jgi:cysteine desulfurase family protein (TIGR01976 family)
MAFDVARFRTSYPALAEGFAHFDGAAGTLVAEPVAAAVAGTLRTAIGNRADTYEAGRRSNAIVDAARSAVADLVGGEPSGVAFGPSATALTYAVSRALADSWSPGDEIMVTRLDHDSNVRPWVQAAARAGATVRWLDVDPASGVLATPLFGPRTRLIAVTAASNAIGTRPDLAEISADAHSRGVLVYVDGVHATPHQPTDVAAIGADFYVTSAYKWSGPHLAACVAAPSRWAALHPDKLMPSPDSVPDRFEFGTLPFEQLAGVTAAVDHLSTMDPQAAGLASRRERLVASIEAAHGYAASVFHSLLEGLRTVPGVRILPAPSGGCPTVSFLVDGQDPADTARVLGDQGICVSSGNYYAYEYFQVLGLPGAVRASVYHYTTLDDVLRLVEGISRIRSDGR